MKSEIVIFDLATGALTPVLASERLIEAPNWTADGAALIVNGDGRLYRVPLAAPALLPVDTGFANECNNDHGLSPDGRMLAISDRSQGGESAVYVLDAAGGAPRPVTTLMPSYWHGWSPDGRRLAYAAKRGDGPFGIYTIAIEGGEETCVTVEFDHCDGPDYSADGKWIWFNAERGGAMQIWRIRPDGSGAEQMTADGDWNWFPHPSPCGRHVVYLAYPPGTRGHPRDCEVELRLMAQAGGAWRTLAALFGGQGTINVPSWHPDGDRFAFVRYARP